MSLLTDRTAVVTGSASGIGRAIATTFAEHGADVVIADRRATPRTSDGKPTHEWIAEKTDSRSVYVECDVTDVSSLDRAIEAADRFGGIDVMVNNAGIYWRKPALEVTESDFDDIFAVNAKGVFFGTQRAAWRMVDTGGGTVLNLSSIAGLRGAGGEVPYAASKGAVTLMSYSFAAELGPLGVRVNSLHPGFIKTALHTEDTDNLTDEDDEAKWEEEVALRRLGEPEDVAAVATLLASEYGSYLNGVSLPVDGGWVNQL